MAVWLLQGRTKLKGNSLLNSQSQEEVTMSCSTAMVHQDFTRVDEYLKILVCPLRDSGLEPGWGKF